MESLTRRHDTLRSRSRDEVPATPSQRHQGKCCRNFPEAFENFLRLQTSGLDS